MESENQNAAASFPHGTETSQEDPSSDEKPRKERKPRQARASNDDLDRIEGMLRSSAMLGIGIASRVKTDDAVVIARHTIAPDPQNFAPNVIEAVMELCRQDRKVRAYLAGLAAQSAYVNVAVAFASMTIAVMANHNMVPPIFNPTSPKAPENGTNSLG